MNVPAVPDEIERDRLAQAAELGEDLGPDWPDHFQPGSLGCHELLDRASLVADLLERHIASHPACVANPDWFRLAHRAAALVQELYQAVGAAHDSEDE